jgi:hypothetical protein
VKAPEGSWPTARRLRAGATLAALTVLSIALGSATSGTLAAWTDDEYVGAAAGVVVAGDCSTTTLFQTESAARQVSGFVGGQDLDSLAAVQGIQVGNSGGTLTVHPGTASQVDPLTFISNLDATALGSPLLGAAVGLNQPAGSAGAYTQWAQAKANGQATGAAGLVSDQSGIIDATGTATGSSTAPTTASINLAPFLPASQAAMTLEVGAVASTSAIDACVMNSGWPALAADPQVTRQYRIADLRLNLSARSVQPATEKTSATLGGIDKNLTDLASPTSSLTANISTGLTGLLAGSGLAVASVSTEVNFGTPDLAAAKSLLGKSLTDGVVAIDLADSRIYVDLGKLTHSQSPGLNGRSPNSPLVLDDAALKELTERSNTLLRDWANAVSTEVKKALDNTTFSMTSQIRLTVAGIPAKITAGYNTTVGAMLAQHPPAPTITPEIGLLNLHLLDPVTSVLLGGTGAVVSGALNDALTQPGALLAATGNAIQDSADTVAEEAVTALAPLINTLSLTLNVQPDQPGAAAADIARAVEGQYRVSALRIAAVGSSAELYFATATAGPVSFRPSLVG